MAKHTAKAIRSGLLPQAGSKHSAAAMSHTTGYGVNGTRSAKHSSAAMSRAGRPTKPSAQIREIAQARVRRNTTGIPKSRGA